MSLPRPPLMALGGVSRVFQFHSAGADDQDRQTGAGSTMDGCTRAGGIG
jgi:hypothetical protein